MIKKTTVLLINLGTPKSPKVKDVRRYLSEFLNDRRVIDIPWLFRKLLVNLVIVPFRAPKSAKLYKELWTQQGSPLMYHSQEMAKKLQSTLGTNYNVKLAMRYQLPSLTKVMEQVAQENTSKLIVIPLYPQYASSTTGSIIDKVMSIMQHWEVIPEVTFINQFYKRDGFLDALIHNAKKYDITQYDHFLFSFHGLPIRQVQKVHPQRKCNQCECEQIFNPLEDQYCYKATCFETSRLLAKKLGIPSDKYTVAFQSRISKEWLTPFSDIVIEQLAHDGCKKLMVFSPSFVTDCLETTIEIGKEYKELFIKNGGSHLQLLDSVNCNPLWIETLKKLVEENS